MNKQNSCGQSKTEHNTCRRSFFVVVFWLVFFFFLILLLGLSSIFKKAVLKWSFFLKKKPFYYVLAFVKLTVRGCVLFLFCFRLTRKKKTRTCLVDTKGRSSSQPASSQCHAVTPFQHFNLAVWVSFVSSCGKGKTGSLHGVVCR